MAAAVPVTVQKSAGEQSKEIGSGSEKQNRVGVLERYGVYASIEDRLSNCLRFEPCKCNLFSFCIRFCYSFSFD